MIKFIYEGTVYQIKEEDVYKSNNVIELPDKGYVVLMPGLGMNPIWEACPVVPAKAKKVED